jgi:nucleotide-binding universal stress UspA family protein
MFSRLPLRHARDTLQVHEKGCLKFLHTAYHQRCRVMMRIGKNTFEVSQGDTYHPGRRSSARGAGGFRAYRDQVLSRGQRYRTLDSTGWAGTALPRLGPCPQQRARWCSIGFRKFPHGLFSFTMACRRWPNTTVSGVACVKAAAAKGDHMANRHTDSFLVGIDNSDCSRRALEFARQRAKSMNARLILAYVIEWSPYSFNTPEENEQRHKRREEEITIAHASVLAPALASLEGSGVVAEGIVRHGNVAKVLNDLAVEHGAIQIVVGKIGASGLKSLIFGSVTSKLVQLASVPVTVVP